MDKSNHINFSIVNYKKFVFILFTIALLACRPGLPEQEGVYVYSGKASIRLDSVKIENAHVNNLCGIKTINQAFESVDSMYVNLKQGKGNYSISKLKFHTGMFVDGIAGNHRKWLKTEFWIAETKIICTNKKWNDDGTKSMLITANKLEVGCYAFHFKPLDDCAEINDSGYCYAFKIVTKIP